MKRTVAILLLALTAPAAAQPANMDNVQIRIERVAPGVAVLFGRGGNIGLSFGSDGNILIDDQYAPLTERILAAIRSLDPVRSASSSTPTGTATIPAGTRMSAAPAR